MYKSEDSRSLRGRTHLRRCKKKNWNYKTKFHFTSGNKELRSIFLFLIILIDSCLDVCLTSPNPPPCKLHWSWPALSGDARTEDVKLILGYAVNRIADSSVFPLFQQSLPFLIPSTRLSPLTTLSLPTVLPVPSTVHLSHLVTYALKLCQRPAEVKRWVGLHFFLQWATYSRSTNTCTMWWISAQILLQQVWNTLPKMVFMQLKTCNLWCEKNKNLSLHSKLNPQSFFEADRVSGEKTVF